MHYTLMHSSNSSFVVHFDCAIYYKIRNYLLSVQGWCYTSTSEMWLIICAIHLSY